MGARLCAATFGLSRDALYVNATYLLRQAAKGSVEIAGPPKGGHLHADECARPQYHFSVILYLTTHGNSLGGRTGFFRFRDDSDHIEVSLGAPLAEHRLLIEPLEGRVVLFTSGWENLHYVSELMQGSHPRTVL